MTALIFSATMATGAAAAPLTVDIAGTPGSGQVSATFGGSQTASGAGVFGSDTDEDGFPDRVSQFRDLQRFLADRDLDVIQFRDTSGSASVSVNDGTETISEEIVGLALDADGNSQDDVWFLFTTPMQTLSFQQGDMITLSGMLDIVGLDIDDLNTGVFTSTGGISALSLADVLDLRLTITELPPTAAIPLPAGLPLLIGAMGCLAVTGRRRRS